MKVYPDWVIKHKKSGTSIKQIGDNYYLYACTSKYDKNKGYPVSIQRYIGRITEGGLIEPEKITFIPGKDKIVLMKDEFDLSMFTDKEKELIENIPLIKVLDKYYTGLLPSKVITTINKYYALEEGVLRK